MTTTPGPEAALHIHGRDSITLSEAFTALDTAAHGALFLGWSASEVLVGRVAADGGVSVVRRRGDAYEEAQADVGGVFEARVVHPDWELRWLHDEGGRGRARLLAETADAPEWTDSTKQGTITAVETIEQTYLLWGAGTDPAPAAGWSRLHEHRIGDLMVPIAGATRSAHHIQLTAREYVAVEPEHGNAYIAAERLLGLSGPVMWSNRDEY